MANMLMLSNVVPKASRCIPVHGHEHSVMLNNAITSSKQRLGEIDGLIEIMTSMRDYADVEHVIFIFLIQIVVLFKHYKPAFLIRLFNCTTRCDSFTATVSTLCF
jgi:hypothetical protein